MLAQECGRGGDIVFERPVGRAAAVAVAAEVQAEHSEPLSAGFAAEGRVPGSQAARPMTHD